MAKIIGLLILGTALPSYSQYVTRSEAESIARSAAASAPYVPSADEIATAIKRKEDEEKIIAMAQRALSACRIYSATLKARKDSVIPKSYFTEARAYLDCAVTAAPVVRTLHNPELAHQLDDAAYELRVLVLAMDK